MTTIGAGIGVAVGVAVGRGVGVGVGVEVGPGVGVGGSGVAVGGTGVAVGGRGVGVAVGSTGVAVGTGEGVGVRVGGIGPGLRDTTGGMDAPYPFPAIIGSVGVDGSLLPIAFSAITPNVYRSPGIRSGKTTENVDEESDAEDCTV